MTLNRAISEVRIVLDAAPVAIHQILENVSSILFERVRAAGIELRVPRPGLCTDNEQ